MRGRYLIAAARRSEASLARAASAGAGLASSSATSPVPAPATRSTTLAALTPVEETLQAPEHLVQAGKVRYVGSTPIYPYWHQRQFKERNPTPVG